MDFFERYLSLWVGLCIFIGIGLGKLFPSVVFNSSLAYGLSKVLNVPHSIAAPSALIGASNFFELAVAVTISIFGLQSGATLATVVGVLVEVPVMLSVCNFCNRTRHWFRTPKKNSDS